MTLPNIFTEEVANEVIERIEKLNPTSLALWGKMNVGQMLAHCNVTYDMAFTEKYAKPSFIVRFLLKTFVKNGVCNTTPYAKNIRTAPQFVITDQRDFDTEKSKLIAYIRKCQDLGENHFDGRESHSFGKLSKLEWNNMFYKHLNHHLTQFGV
jgi:hypothetical protein